MSHIFISHTEDDKVGRIKPLIEVLVAEGEPVWVDRPGTDGFGFSQRYIEQNRINHLRSGEPWSESVSSAIQSAGAVLGCLSRAFGHHRQILSDEFVAGQTLGKLVTCIIDDLPHEELTQFTTGLLDLSRMQAIRVSPDRLRQALDYRATNGMRAEDLPQPLREAWESVRNLIGSINQVRTTPRQLRRQDIERLVPILDCVPIGPPLKVAEIEPLIIGALADNASGPEQERSIVEQANVLLLCCQPDQLARPEELTLRRGAMLPYGSTRGDLFWTEAFREAGLLSRRTVVALLINPASTWAMEKAQVRHLVDNLVGRLKQPVQMK